MKKLFLVLVQVVLFIPFPSIAQAPIIIVESTFKIAGMGEEVFYYGFSEGDKLVFNFEEVNGKELKEVEIVEYPTS